MDVGNLAALAGDTLVAAAATDAWDAVRHKIACLFGRGEADPAIERRLAVTREKLAAAPAADLQQVKAYLSAAWATRLADLLEDWPDAGAELRGVIDEIAGMLPSDAVISTGHGVAAGHDLSISADRGSVAAGVIHGGVTAPSPLPPGPISG